MRTQSYVFGEERLLSCGIFVLSSHPCYNPYLYSAPGCPYTHTSIIRLRTNCTVGLKQYFSQIILWYNKVLLNLMEFKMNIFALLKNRASIILATIVLACRIVLIFMNAVSRYIILIAYSIFAHCTSRHGAWGSIVALCYKSVGPGIDFKW